jgi:hypothetical protein
VSFQNLLTFSPSLCAYILYYHQDSWGDGLAGYYKVIHGDQEVSGGGNFKHGEYKTLGSPIDGRVCSLPCILGDEKFCPSCSKNEKLMKVLAFTDANPEETSWSVRDTCTNQFIMGGGPYDEKFEPIGEAMCVPVGSKYEVTIQQVRSILLCFSLRFKTYYFSSKEST